MIAAKEARPDVRQSDEIGQWFFHTSQQGNALLSSAT